MRRAGLGVLGCLVGAGLIASGVSPVWAAAKPQSAGESAVVGGFGLGDGLEAAVDEQSGSFGFGLPAGGVDLGWDSRAVGVDRHGLGGGWRFGLAFVQVDGGVVVFPAGGGAYPADASAPTGLAGYTLGDARFEQTPGGVLPARVDGTRGDVAYAYVLHELGGSTTYFSAAGDPIAAVTATGLREDWSWQAGDLHRLVELIDTDGVVTSVAWRDATGEFDVRPGANLPERGAAWTVRLVHGAVAGVVSPDGTRTQVRTDESGLVTEVAGPSGARTDVRWRAHLDGVARVERVRTIDGGGAEVSARTWRPVDDVQSPSGWPATEVAEGRPGTGSVFSSVIGDGRTEVESTYNMLGSLIRRVTSGTSGSGRAELKAQTFQYPGTDDAGRPTVQLDELPKHWASPTVATATTYNAEGARRDATLHTEFDEHGRLVGQTGVDGVIHTYTYDQARAGAVNPPVGLKTGERSVASDGLVTEVEYELDDARTSVIAATGYSGRDGGPLVVTGRTEYTVEDDGFVSERRVFPAETGDAAGAASAPRVTRWHRVVDLHAGVATLTETIGVGTPAEATRASTSSLLHGGVLTQTGPVGETASATYDELGRVVSATDSAGRTTETVYETAQRDGRNAVTVTGADGVAVTEVRDVLGRVEQVTDNIDDGVATLEHVRVAELREYPAPGQLRVTDAWGAVSSTREDVFGRTVETIAPTGLRTVSVHDDIAGTVTTGATPTGDLADADTTTTTTTDLAGRVTERTGTRADGVEVPTMGVVYDGFGREVATTGGPIESTTEYDVYGRVVDQTHTPAGASEASVTTADAAMSVQHEFDAYGAPEQKTVTGGEATYSGVKQTFDELGRTIAETDQAGITTSYQFAPDGLVTRATTSTGQTTDLVYDAARQVVRASRSADGGGDPVVIEYERDPATGQVTASFDPVDRGGTELSYTYDAFGNTLTTTYPDGKQIVRDYDRHGRLEATTDIAGITTRNTYDHTGLLISAIQTAPDTAELARISFTYDVYGRVLTADRGNGVRTAYEYSSADEPTRELTTTNGRTTADRAYTYDTSGRVIQRIDRIADDAGTLTATTTTYEYDGFDKLIASTVHDGDTTDAAVTTTTRYENTVAGDVARETVTTGQGSPEEQHDERTFEYTPAGELTAVTTTDGAATARVVQEYDVNGNLIRDLEGTTYAYDTANRVIEQTTTDGTTTRTEYWSDGSRKQLTTVDANGDEATSAFYWAGDTLLNDTHTGIGETGTASYLFGTARQARTVTVSDGERTEHDTRYLGTDRHSNTTELTDEHGDVTTRYAYSDYGTTTVTDASGEQPVADAVVGDATRNPIQYASGYTDPSGRQHLDARDYDSVTMRFDTPDHAAMLTNYAFAGLNPIMKVDPSGRSEIGDAIINGALAAVGLGSAAWTISQIGAPSLAALGPAGLFWWSVAFVAVIGDFVSTGIAVAELVHDGGTRFIRDQDREALTISGIVIGAVAAALGPIATSLKNHFKAAHARRSALADPLSDSDAEDLVKSKSDSEDEVLGDGDHLMPNDSTKPRTQAQPNSVVRHDPADGGSSSSSDTVDFEDEVEVIAPKTKYTGTADHDVFAQFVTVTETNITALGKRFEGRVELITLTRLLRKPPLRRDGTQLTQRMVWHCYVSDESKLLDTISEKLSSNQPVLPGHQAAITNITDDIAAMRLHFQ